MEGYRGALEEACADWPQICSITTTPAPHQGTNVQVGQPSPKSASRIPLVAERMGQLLSKNSKLGRYEKVQTWADMRKVHQQCSLLSLRTTSLSQHEITEHVKQVWLNVIALSLYVCVSFMCPIVVHPNPFVSPFSSIFIHLCPWVTVFIHFCPMTYLKPHKLTNVDLCCQ